MDRKRLLRVAATCFILGGLWWYFFGDKESPSEPVEVPLAWIGDDLLLTAERGRLFVRTSSAPRVEIFSLSEENTEFAEAPCIGSDSWWFGTWIISRETRGVSSTRSDRLALRLEGWVDGMPKLGEPVAYDWFAKPFLATCEVDPWQDATTAFLKSSESFKAQHAIRIDGNMVKLEYLDGGLVGTFGGQLFFGQNPAGLINIQGDGVTRHPFPSTYAATLNTGLGFKGGEIIWDRSLGRALFIYNTCLGSQTGPGCRRKGLWLTPELDPLSTIEMPGESLIRIKPGYTCFSCGCGCYSHEDIYAENGIIYAHVWGFPVVGSAQGIYRLLQTPSGPEWEKIVSGRPYAPLAFSPQGDKVAYLELSRLGDEFRITRIPKQP